MKFKRLNHRMKMELVLLSIRPKWVEKIVSGEKTVEVRKTRPKLKTPFKCYIYCTQSRKYIGGKAVKNIWINRGTKSRFIGNGKIIGEFICNNIYTVENRGSCFAIGNEIAITNEVAKASCIFFDDMKQYAGNRNVLYAWHISNLKIYDETKELSDFGLKKPPQSWCYVKEIKE